MMISLDEELAIELGLNIKYKGINIRQRTIREIVQDVGIVNFHNYCFPFIISMDVLGVEAEDINEFDLFWLLAQEKVEDRVMIQTLMDGLIFFLDINPSKAIVDFKKREIKLTKDVTLTRDNFEELAEKIRAITGTTKLKKKSKKEAPKRVVSAYLKVRDKYITKNKKENEYIIKPFKDNLMFLIHYSDKIDYESVLGLTICQLNNSANMYRKKETFKINMEAHYAGQKVNKKDLEHWSS